MGQAIQFFNEVEEGCGDPHYTGATKVAGHNLKIGPATDMKRIQIGDKNGAHFHSRHDESATDITVAATQVYGCLDSSDPALELHFMEQ